MKNLHLLLFLGLSLNLFSQEITEEQRDFYTKTLHGQDSVRYNKTTRNVYKFEEFKESDFYKQVVTQKEIEACQNLVKESVQLNLNQEENQLILTGKLTDRFNIQTSGIFSVDLLESNLTKENGEKFELNTFYNSRSGYGELDFKTDIKSNFSKEDKVNGYVNFNLNYLVGYDKVELTSKDIGKKITLNNCSYKIVDIKENELVLDKDCETDIEIKIINFSKENKVAKPYEYMELMDMVEKDSTIAMASFNMKNRETYKMVRNVFENNPTISLKEFKQIFTVEKLNEMNEKGQYTIVESIAPYGDKFIIYSPKFQSEKLKVIMN